MTVVAGNDAGLPYTGFGRLWQELDALVAGGMTPLEAIASATCTAARVLRMEGQIGTLQPGSAADLILVQGEPWRDISALSRVGVVIQAGAVIAPPEDGCGPQPQ